MSIRGDWLEAIGKEWKPFYTPEELFDILVAFRENDVNGNGVEDEVLNFNLASEWEPISACFGMGKEYIYVLSDGSGVQCKLDHENFPAFIEYCQKLYEAGVFSTEVLSGNEILSGNRASAVYDYYMASYLEPTIVGFEETARYAPVVLDDDGGVNGYQIPSGDNADMCMDAWLVNKDCEDPQAVVDLLDYIYSDQGNLDMFYGIEGVTYEMVDGNPQWLVDYGEMRTAASGVCPLWQVVTCNILPGTLYSVSTDEEQFKKDNHKEGYPEKIAFLDVMLDSKKREVPYSPTDKPYAMASAAETEAWNKVSTTVEAYLSELILDLILGNKSLDDLPEYRQEVGELGLDTMIEIRQARYERYVNN